MDVLARPAEEFDNDSLVEEMWAMKAFEHAEVYFNLLCSVDPRGLRLTPYDDEIYTTFRQDFPHMDVKCIDENEIKSAEGKVKWRSFIEKFNKLDDYSFGSLIRTDASREFGPDNSILVIRIQFWAIEISRNREGLNDYIREKHRKEKGSSSSDTKKE
ncbi:protein PBDC1 [Bradysia coprophila]|uniref:protein PBDC1 n=1 Tax=Bradysia coprophila TaxID=38358 RepID=UPI00187DC45F|nr:protein PBDC1 [Bradysia coprophila]